MSILAQKILAVVLYVVAMTGLWYVVRYHIVEWIPDEIGQWTPFVFLALAPVAVALVIRDKRAARRRAAAAKKDLDNL